jgi:hypothetical protein
MIAPESNQSVADAEAEAAAAARHAHPLTDRRRSTRTKQKFVTQMTPWTAGHASIPFDVIIEDISETGVGLVHDQPIKVGVRHLLTVPRGENQRPVIREYIVVRCDARREGGYAIGLEQQFNRGSIDELPAKRVTSSTTKLLFLLFGIFGLLIAALAPL